MVFGAESVAGCAFGFSGVFPAKASLFAATVENHWVQVSEAYEKELRRMMSDPRFDVFVVNQAGEAIPGLPFQRGARFVRRAEFYGSTPEYAERFELNGPQDMVAGDAILRVAGNEVYDFT